MTHVERRVLFGAAAFALLASLVLHSLTPPEPATLTDYARSGGTIEIRLRPETCAIGGPFASSELNCDFPYIGKRRTRTNGWAFAGHKKGAAAVETNQTSWPDDDSIISLWGTPLKFDDAGRLTFNGREVGTFKRQRAAGREPS